MAALVLRIPFGVQDHHPFLCLSLPLASHSSRPGKICETAFAALIHRALLAIALNGGTHG